MHRLVALALPGGPAYVEAVRRVWDAGDAIAPLDARLPPAEAAKVLEALGPTHVMEADGEIRSLDGGTPAEAGDAVVIATSGTSGRPKAVIHTHEGVIASAKATSTALEVDPGRDRWLACIPLAHIGGLSVVMRSLVTGTDVEVHDGFDAAAVLDAAARGATLVSLVTRALNQIPADAFRTILIGGAAPPADRPPNVIATYGLTETGSGVIYDRTALDGLDYRIVDPGPSGEGEIQLRGPMLFRGYRNLPCPFVDEGWFPTEDIGFIGSDGALNVAGRKDDLIVTGGEKVWPDPVERRLLERDDIAEVAVVGRPDRDWGHRVVAVVVVAEHRPAPSLDELRDHVSAALPRWAAPREVEFRSALPKTALGKIRRAAV